MNNTRAAGPFLPVFLILLAILLQCQSVLAEDQVKDSYVGEKVCASCHKEQSQQWKGSHHDMAMMTASETSVLGDFTNGSLTHDGVTSKFFKRGELKSRFGSYGEEESDEEKEKLSSRKEKALKEKATSAATEKNEDDEKDFVIPMEEM